MEADENAACASIAVRMCQRGRKFGSVFKGMRHFCQRESDTRGRLRSIEVQVILRLFCQEE